MQLVLQLSRNCNLACRYCYQTHRAGRGMSVETALRAVRWAAGAGDGHVAVTYFGGEPLLERETLVESLPRLRRAGALVTAKVSTNGLLLDAELCELAREHALFVSLSTDGLPAAQDGGRPRRDGGASSGAVERALALLVEAKAPFGTYQVLTPDNVGHLAASADWLWERGSRIQISTLDFGADWTQRDLDRLARGYRALARRYVRWTRAGEDFYLAPFDTKISGWTRPAAMEGASCSAGVRQVAVDPDGWIYPCIEFLDDAECRIGHVDRGLERGAFETFRARLGGGRADECGTCGIAERCGSSCACLNYRLEGATEAIDPLLCAHERMVTRAADQIGERLWSRRSRSFLRRQYEPRHHALRALETLVEERTSP